MTLLGAACQIREFPINQVPVPLCTGVRMGPGRSQFGITTDPERQNSLSGVWAAKWVTQP